MPVFLRVTLLLAAMAAPLCGCASRQAVVSTAQADADQTNDPFESTNRFFYRVNQALDAVVLKPVAIAYVNVVPPAGRTGLHNALQNLNSPVLMANQLLQGKPGQSGDTLARLVINSTVGVVGIFDVASDWGYPYHDTDFGITLALWGVPEGPFLFLPVLGPSDPRDATGYLVDAAADPLNYVGKGGTVTTLRYTRFGLYAVDRRSDALGALDGIQKTALDPYATFRSLYRQNRASAVKAAEQNPASSEKPATPASNPPAS
jgi:phospholipid-binding lipoprotein MlaA